MRTVDCPLDYNIIILHKLQWALFLLSLWHCWPSQRHGAKYMQLICSVWHHQLSELGFSSSFYFFLWHSAISYLFVSTSELTQNMVIRPWTSEPSENLPIPRCYCGTKQNKTCSGQIFAVCCPIQSGVLRWQSWKFSCVGIFRKAENMFAAKTLLNKLCATFAIITASCLEPKPIKIRAPGAY